MESLIAAERSKYHEYIVSSGVLSTDLNGVTSNADTSSRLSMDIAGRLAAALGAGTRSKLIGQRAGADFEKANMMFLEATFPKLQNLRPGSWHIVKLGNKSSMKTSSFAQYGHLEHLSELTAADTLLRASLGNDYMISPDVVIYRDPVPDDIINSSRPIVDDTISLMSDLRTRKESMPILHASISAKWTMRSDRAEQPHRGSRIDTEQKGASPPHSGCYGRTCTRPSGLPRSWPGDIDCMYHFALYELAEAVRDSGYEDSIEMLNMLITGKRIKDISDLPLDLAV